MYFHTNFTNIRGPGEVTVKNMDTTVHGHSGTWAQWYLGIKAFQCWGQWYEGTVIHGHNDAFSYLIFNAPCSGM